MINVVLIVHMYKWFREGVTQVQIWQREGSKEKRHSSGLTIYLFTFLRKYVPEEQRVYGNVFKPFLRAVIYTKLPQTRNIWSSSFCALFVIHQYLIHLQLLTKSMTGEEIVRKLDQYAICNIVWYVLHSKSSVGSTCAAFILLSMLKLTTSSWSFSPKITPQAGHFHNTLITLSNSMQIPTKPLYRANLTYYPVLPLFLSLILSSIHVNNEFSTLLSIIQPFMFIQIRTYRGYPHSFLCLFLQGPFQLLRVSIIRHWRY